MAEEYIIFVGTLPNGDFDYMAITPDALKEAAEEDEPFGPEGFFAPGTTDIEEKGRIQILGDTQYLADNFSVKG